MSQLQYSTGPISIHALLAESDGVVGQDCVDALFLSTLCMQDAIRNTQISIHALLAESDTPGRTAKEWEVISIHALLAESDRRCTASPLPWLYFYPRSPCGERLAELRDIFNANQISIHALLAESDRRCLDGPLPRRNFYPRSPCGERPVPAIALLADCISIHALLAESDARPGITRYYPGRFLSTLSLRRATDKRHPEVLELVFLSTLSLRRATRPTRLSARLQPYFYPRSPCGERRRHLITQRIYHRFLSTLSLRRATEDLKATIQSMNISIHALLAESDAGAYCTKYAFSISIHALLAESDAAHT